MVMDKIALALLIVGGLNWGCIGLFPVRFGGLCLWRFGQPDQPDHLYSRRPVSGMVYLSALPGHDGPAHPDAAGARRLNNWLCHLFGLSEQV